MLTKEKVLLINDLEKIPSAQPYTINPDGRLWITVDDIDKVTAVVVDEHKSKFCKQFYEDYEDAQPKTGKWKNIVDGIEYTWGTCDSCGARIPMPYKYYKYCPNCGADMIEVTI